MEPSGNAIWSGTYNMTAKIVMNSLMPRMVQRDVTLSAMYGDAVPSIAFNPGVKDEVTIAATRKYFFISRDRSINWTQIVHEGDTVA